MAPSDASLRAVVQDYIGRHRPRALAELQAYRDAPSLETVVRQAALTLLPSGKRDPHHTRRSQAVLDEAAARLLARLDAIEAAPDFARLLEVVTKAVRALTGLGKLYCYDTALRIGAKKGVAPTRVYLHSGTSAGAQLLGFQTHGRVAIDVADLPAPLRVLAAYEIEDVLCIHKNRLAGGAATEDRAPVCWPDEPIDTSGA